MSLFRFFTLLHDKHKKTFFHFVSLILVKLRLFGTPNEKMWPGVSTLKNWHEYPQWKPSSLSSSVPNLDEAGLDLLSVSPKFFSLAIKTHSTDELIALSVFLEQKLLQYEPAKRISAKMAMEHPYFDDLPDKSSLWGFKCSINIFLSFMFFLVLLLLSISLVCCFRPLWIILLFSMVMDLWSLVCFFLFSNLYQQLSHFKNINISILYMILLFETILEQMQQNNTYNNNMIDCGGLSHKPHEECGPNSEWNQSHRVSPEHNHWAFTLPSSEKLSNCTCKISD